MYLDSPIVRLPRWGHTAEEIHAAATGADPKVFDESVRGRVVSFR